MITYLLCRGIIAPALHRCRVIGTIAQREIVFP
jgi:hypothetical protein